MALGGEEDDVLASMLPFGPWARFRAGWGMERSRSVAGLGGRLTAWRFRGFSSMLFGAFYAGTLLSCVKAFLTDYRVVILISYRVCRENRSEGPLRAFWRHVRLKACEGNAVEWRRKRAGPPDPRRFSSLYGIIEVMLHKKGSHNERV